MCDLPMEGVEHGQGIRPWTPESGYTDHKRVTNQTLKITGHPFILYLLHIVYILLDRWVQVHIFR